MAAATAATTARAARMGDGVLLDVRNLRTSFHTRDGVVRAVTGVSFTVNHGEILGLVGESGCGKSVTSLSILGLNAQGARVEGGPVLFDGKDLLTMPADELRQLRGDRIAMIFQQPTSSLNPVMDVGHQIGEVLEIHRNMKRKAARDRVLELLRMVGIPDPKRRIDAYPHEMSGGMAQRVMIAMALACEPELLIADEPTTALDVTIQAQILDLMRNLQKETGTAIVLITHDLGVVAEMCDRVAVMYAGEIVEQADVRTLFADPKHPYTKGLIGSVPGARRDQGRAGHDPGQRAQPHRPAARLPLRAALLRARRARQRPGRAAAPRAAAGRAGPRRPLLALPHGRRPSAPGHQRLSDAADVPAPVAVTAAAS